MPQQGWLLVTVFFSPTWLDVGQGGELSPCTLCFSKGHPRGILVLDGFGWFGDFLATLMGATRYSTFFGLTFPHQSENS